MIVDIMEILGNCLQLPLNTLIVIQKLYMANNSFNQIYLESKPFGQQTCNS